MIHGRGSSWRVSLVIITSTIKSRPVLCSRQANNDCQFRNFVGPIRGPVRKHSPGRIEKISGPVSKGTGNRVKYNYTRVSCCEAYVQGCHNLVPSSIRYNSNRSQSYAEWTDLCHVIRSRSVHYGLRVQAMICVRVTALSRTHCC